MIITRTPYRISFFGGGTDYPKWFLNNTGEVLSTSINKYCYITCRSLPPFFDYKTRVVWSKIELCNKVSEINHPSVRETLNYLSMNTQGLEIHHAGDLPARSGIGSSSSFTVGLVNALSKLNGVSLSKKTLANKAIHIEQNLIKENVGSQDQVCATYGGLNHIVFNKKNNFTVNKLDLSGNIITNLNKHLMLFFTGLSRSADSVAKEVIKNIKINEKLLLSMQSNVQEVISILNSNSSINDFGKLLHEAWLQKKKLSNVISNEYIDSIYNLAIKSGAIGGKLLGAGKGGFILFFVPLDIQDHFKKKLNFLLNVPFEFENSGSQIIYKNDKYNKD